MTVGAPVTGPAAALDVTPPEPRAITFESRPDGTWVLHPWPAAALFSRRLVEVSRTAPHHAVDVVDDEFRICVENGRAVYRLAPTEDPFVYRGDLLPGSTFEAP